MQLHIPLLCLLIRIPTACLLRTRYAHTFAFKMSSIDMCFYALTWRTNALLCVCNSLGGSYNVLFACESTCKAVIDACQPSVDFLMSIGALPANPLPDCSKPVSGTEMYPGGGVPFQPDASCNSVPCKLILFVFVAFDRCL